MMPRSDPKAAPISRFSVIFRTCNSKNTMAKPRMAPAAAANGAGSSKGLRYQAERPSRRTKKMRKNKRLLSTDSPSSERTYDSYHPKKPSTYIMVPLSIPLSAYGCRTGG